MRVDWLHFIVYFCLFILGPNFRFSTGAESSPSPVFLTIDRPFIFFIRHVSTKSILFIGQYSQFVEC